MHDARKRMPIAHHRRASAVPDEVQSENVLCWLRKFSPTTRCDRGWCEAVSQSNRVTEEWIRRAPLPLSLDRNHRTIDRSVLQVATQKRTGRMKFIIGLVVAILVVLIALSAMRLLDQRADRAEWDRLSALQPSSPEIFDPAIVAGLPEPARRYFSYTIEPGTP